MELPTPTAAVVRAAFLMKFLRFADSMVDSGQVGESLMFEQGQRCDYLRLWEKMPLVKGYNAKLLHLVMFRDLIFQRKFTENGKTKLSARVFLLPLSLQSNLQWNRHFHRVAEPGYDLRGLIFSYSCTGKISDYTHYHSCLYFRLNFPFLGQTFREDFRYVFVLLLGPYGILQNLKSENACEI
jgi:hypothetical protein